MRQHIKERLDPGELTSVGSGTFNKAEPKKKIISSLCIDLRKDYRSRIRGREKGGRIKWKSSAAQLSSCSPGELHKERQVC